MLSLSTGLSLTSNILRPLSGGVSISFGAPLSVDDDAAVSTVIARASVSGDGGPYTFTLTNNAGGQFAITAGGELSVAAALTEGLQTITVSATDGVNDPITSTKSVSVNSLPANTVAPVFAGTPEVGETGTTDNGTWTGFPAPTFTYQVERDGVDTPGEEAASYSFSDADDETDVHIAVTATNVRDSVTVDSNALSITYAQPVAAGEAVDQAFTDDSGVQTYDASGDFTGGNLTFSLTTSLTGVTINSSTGIVTFDTDTLAVQSGTSVAVRAANSGGSADSSFSLTIAAAGGDTYELELDASNAGSFTFSSGSDINQWDDQSGNSRHATQSTVANQPDRDTSGTPFVHFDESDDQLTVDFGSTFNGEIFQGTPLGVARYTINVVGGSWTFPTNAQYAIDGGRRNGIIAVDGVASDPAAINADLAAMGAGSDYSAATSMPSWFRGRTDITEIDGSGWDMSGISSIASFAQDASNLTTVNGVGSWNTPALTNMGSAFRSCTSLSSIDLSGLDTSGVTAFNQTFRACSSLTSIDLSNWDTASSTTFIRFARDCSSLTTVALNGGTGNPFADSACTNYAEAFRNTNLTQQSIDDILVAIEAAGTSNGTFGQSGGSSPSSTGEAAVTALRGRGWTVTVTGGF